MKLIGKQIVVELPKKRLHEVDGFNAYESAKAEGRNDALAEVARMNPAWEVDEENIKIILEVEKSLFHNQTWLEFKTNVAHALASDQSAWMKRKE